MPGRNECGAARQAGVARQVLSLRCQAGPATGGRKRIMLQALTNPERATYEQLSGALERWKSLNDKKKDQFGRREAPEPTDLTMQL